MLVLSRKPGEHVVIGDDVRVTVLAIRGNQVRLGLTAPAGTSLRRLELCPQADRPGDQNACPPRSDSRRRRLRRRREGI